MTNVDPPEHGNEEPGIEEVWEDASRRPRHSDDFSGRTPSRRPFVSEQPKIGRFEIPCLLLVVLLCDLTIYRGEGLGGFAALFAIAPILLFLGAPQKQLHSSVWLIWAMLLVLSARLIWCGSVTAVLGGFCLIVCFSMSLRGQPPWLLHTFVFAGQTLAAGHRGLNHYVRSMSKMRSPIRKAGRLSLLLPIITFVAFSTLFVLANPDLLASVSHAFADFLEPLSEWLLESLPHVLEFLFWIGVSWITVGAMRPGEFQPEEQEVEDEVTETRPAPLFEAFRNTLLTLNALFAVYLVFEFRTLWFREFPKGFHFSGYAHEGAFWLTVALALATVLLSVIFRGRILNDSRLISLRRLSWIWSLLNVILALAVYNRLSIYVDFNGMTRMRTVGLLGISSVLVGFILVVRKITAAHDFRWLLRRQLWTVAFAAFLYVTLPVDAWVMRYNVKRIMSGDPAPCVQISVHPTSSEGLLQLLPLIDCPDENIRNGVLALLAKYAADSEKRVSSNQQLGWTTYQISDVRLLDELRNAKKVWAVFSGDRSRRRKAIAEFREYAYNWF